MAEDLRRSAAAIIPVVVGALPWLVATVLNQSPTTGDPGGAEAFALRAEPGLGASSPRWAWAGSGTPTRCRAVGRLGGAPSRRSCCSPSLARGGGPSVVECSARNEWGVSRPREVTLPTSSARVLLVVAAVLALLTTALAVFASTTPGLAVMSALLEHVPGAGLLRDTQKFLALLLPAVAIGVARGGRGADAPRARRVRLRGCRAADRRTLARRGAASAPVDLPSDWQAVAQMIPDDQGAVALWPTGMTRDYSFAPTQSLDPARRLLRAPVLEDGELEVDGKPVDADPLDAGAQVRLALEEGPGRRSWPHTASDGSSWRNRAQRSAVGIRLGHTGFRGDYLTLYRVENPVIVPGASPVHRATMIVLHLVWLAVLVLACLLAGLDTS